MFNDIFIKKFKDYNFKHEFLCSSNLFHWDQLAGDLTYCPVHYDSSFIRYQHAYLVSTNAKVKDLSSIIFFEHKPVALWPLFAVFHDGQWNLHINEPVISQGLTPSQNKKLNNTFLSIISIILEKLNCDSALVQGFHSNSCTNSEWSRFLWSKDFRCLLRQELLVDLSFPIDNIRKKFRKSYWNLIKQHKNRYTVTVYRNDISQQIWNEFRNLHELVAGRKTRSVESWNLQYASVLENKAFYIRVSNDNDEIIGGSYFLKNKHEVLYGVAAYDRALAGVPIGHLSIERAILESVDQGCLYLRLGSCTQNFSKNYSEKQIGILNFKQGFATTTATVCDYHLKNF